MPSRLLAALALVVSACSDQGSPVDSGTDVKVGDAAVTYPAAHPPMATVPPAGGPIMTSPKVVAITFDGDPFQAKIDDFTSKIGGSTYWSGAVSEYGVGALTATSIHLTESPPTATLTDADVQAWLTARISGVASDAGAADAGEPAFPAPDGNTVYAIFYTQFVQLTLMGFPSCSGFDGYHGDFKIGSQSVTYAVLMRCGTLDALTVAASHELAESATDPLSQSKPAYIQPDPDHTVWEYSGGGGELGDMCSAFPGVLYKPSDLPYQVQRIWSNANALASHDPCQPNGVTPYFNSAPVLNDTFTVNDPMAGTFTTKGVHIPVGQSGTVELDLYSDAPTSGPWTITVLDVASTLFGSAPELTFSLDSNQGQNGDKVHLTITPIKAGQGGASAFWIQNQLGSAQSVWLGLVGN